MRFYTNSEMDHAINELIHSSRDRDIMRRRLIDGLTMEALSEEFDMSVSQIKRIVKKHLATLNDTGKLLK